MELPRLDHGLGSATSVATVALVVSVLLVPAVAVRADWPQFRGPNGAGISSSSVPIEFGANRNERWRVDVASGHSSPCIVGDSIFLTTYRAETDELHVVCHDRLNGSPRWQYRVAAEAIEAGHPSFNPASSTPAADTERVVAYFGSYGLICLDHAGKRQWEFPLPLAKSYGGNGISPIIVGDRVILYRGNHTDHFLIALNKRSGETIWKVELPEQFTRAMACTGTPIEHDGLIVLHSVNSVQAFRVDNGERVWRAPAATTATSTPVLAKNEVIVATWNQTGEPALTPVPPTFQELVSEHDQDGDHQLSKAELPRMMVFHRSEGTDAPSNGMPLFFGWVDEDKDGLISKTEWHRFRVQAEANRAKFVEHGMLAIPLASQGPLNPNQFRNLERQAIPEVPSPLYYDGLIYFVKNGGILTCLDHATGERVYRKRTGGKATHYASPVIAGDRMYCTAGNGDVSVIQLGREFKQLALNTLGEAVYATPAIVDGTIYIRTHTQLIAFGE